LETAEKPRERRDMDASTKNSTKSKIKILPFHPLADIFPLMQGDELEELAEDIQRRGLIELITVAEGMIADGRNRALACQKAGIEPGYTPYRGSAEDLPRFIISKNIHRRHLKPEQRHNLIKNVLAWDPARSDHVIAAELGVDHKTVGAVRRRAEATGEFSPVEKRRGRDGKTRKQPTRKVKIATPALGKDDVGDSHGEVAGLTSPTTTPVEGRAALELIAQPSIPTEQAVPDEAPPELNGNADHPQGNIIPPGEGPQSESDLNAKLTAAADEMSALLRAKKRFRARHWKTVMRMENALVSLNRALKKYGAVLS
jgi:hypothetical protein